MLSMFNDTFMHLNMHTVGWALWAPASSVLVWWLAWPCAGSFAGNHSCSEFMSTAALPAMSRKPCFAAVPACFCLLHSFHPLFLDDLWVMSGGQMMQVYHLGPSILQLLILCALADFEFLYSSLCTAENHFSDEGWELHWSLGIEVCCCLGKS